MRLLAKAGADYCGARLPRSADSSIAKTRGMNLRWDKSVGSLITGQMAIGVEGA
jgi:hypothetical protein